MKTVNADAAPTTAAKRAAAAIAAAEQRLAAAHAEVSRLRAEQSAVRRTVPPALRRRAWDQLERLAQDAEAAERSARSSLDAARAQAAAWAAAAEMVAAVVGDDELPPAARAHVERAAVDAFLAGARGIALANTTHAAFVAERDALRQRERVLAARRAVRLALETAVRAAVSSALVPDLRGGNLYVRTAERLAAERVVERVADGRLSSEELTTVVEDATLDSVEAALAPLPEWKPVKRDRAEEHELPPLYPTLDYFGEFD